MEGPRVRGSVTEKGCCHPVVPFDGAAQGSADSDGYAAANDAVGSKDPQVQISNVHGAALALAIARRLA